MTHRMRYTLIFIMAWGSTMAAVYILCILDLCGVEWEFFDRHPIDCYLWLYTVISMIGISFVKKDSLHTPPDVHNEKTYITEKLIIRTVPKIPTVGLQWIARIVCGILMAIFTVVTIRLIVFLALDL